MSNVNEQRKHSVFDALFDCFLWLILAKFGNILLKGFLNKKLYYQIDNLKN